MIVNMSLFIFLLPAIIYSAYSVEHKPNLELVIGGGIIFVAFIFVVSFKSYYQGIEMEDMEGRLTRYGPMSAGDKEFFELMSKPFAFMIQFAMLFMHFIIFKDLYWDF